MGKQDETKQAASPSPGSLPLPVGSHRKASVLRVCVRGAGSSRLMAFRCGVLRDQRCSPLVAASSSEKKRRVALHTAATRRGQPTPRSCPRQALRDAETLPD